MSHVVEWELIILLSLIVLIGLWLVQRQRGTPPVPLRTRLINILVVGGTWSFAFARTGHHPDYGVVFAAVCIALFQLDGVPTPRTDLFTRVFTVVGAWWILYRA